MDKKIGILIENRFIEKEIFYYQSRFEEEHFNTVFLTRLWGQKQLKFKGLEFNAEFTAENSFEEINDKDLEDYAAIIMPAGYVADYLLYSEKAGDISPAAKFIERVMKNKKIIKGFICHSLWIASPIKEVFSNRVVTCHNNIISHVKNAGMIYVDKDINIDNDLITARTGTHYPLLVKKIIESINK